MPNFPNRCQHIKVNGTLCGSPALRRNRFCYFHKLHHEERLVLNTDRARRSRNVTIDLPVLEDANAIQVSLMQIMRLIITGQIDGKNAGLLLYALQTASANLPRVRFEPFKNDVVLDLKTVHETPINAHIWEDEDFLRDQEEDNEEAMRLEAYEEAQRRARMKIELDRWAEAEADRLAAEGRRQHEAARQAAAVTQSTTPAAAAQESSAPTVTPAGRAVLPATQTAPPLRRHPPASASMDEVRKRVSAEIRKALPAIAAAQSARENRSRNG
jgi:hypothetical protein